MQDPTQDFRYNAAPRYYRPLSQRLSFQDFHHANRKRCCRQH